jgi:hypothetical protein
MKDNLKKFKMELGELINDPFYLPPEDPLNEFSDFEMGLKRFCFENNCCISLKIDDELIQDLDLYHDVLDFVENGLIKDLSNLSVGKSVLIGLTDTLSLTLTPMEDRVDCKFERIGRPEEKYYVLNLSQVLKTLSRLVDEILNMAIAKGYITAADAQTELGWQPK